MSEFSRLEIITMIQYTILKSRFILGEMFMNISTNKNMLVKFIFFFYLQCPFGTLTMMALHNFLFLVTFSNVFAFTIVSTACSAMHLHKILTVNISCECQIFLAFFPHYVSGFGYITLRHGRP